jgi:hypothetical protein
MAITLDEEVARWARVRAAERDTSVSWLVGELLREKPGPVTGGCSRATGGVGPPSPARSTKCCDPASGVGAGRAGAAPGGRTRSPRV